MTEELDDLMTPNEAYRAEFAFKGQKLEPFSEDRKSIAFSLGIAGFSNREPSPFDMHAIIYICLCKEDDLSKAITDRNGFVKDILKWSKENVKTEDYKEEGETVSKILEAAFATQVSIVSDLSSNGAAMGNAPSQ